MSQTKSITNDRQDFQRRRMWFLIVIISITVMGIVGIEKSRVTAMTGELSPSMFLSEAQQKSGQEIKVAEQVYKNIQVFKGLPASELELTMAFISGSLGVKCNYCHANPFDKDDKPTKQTARRMIRMVFDLNKGRFNGEKAVSCYTCHRGKPKPVSVPAVGQNLWQPNPGAAKENPLPTVDQILSRYVQALGGAPAFQKVTTRVARGSRIGADGVLVPEDVYQKAPNKLLTVTTYPDVAFSTGFNGIAGWGRSSKGDARELPGPVLAQLKTDSEFYKEIKTNELYRKLTLVGKSTIGDREVYVIEATPVSGSPEKLFFDVRTRLLVRRYMESETLLGMFPLQTDYEDYRETDGIKQPFLIHWSMPGRTWGRKIVEVKQNVDIDDARFNPPSFKP
jgi:photosynthetic reaction center cytochrome c subunit